ncbi:hypothetical protein KIPB_007063 [Kipferlia bialata]|uniref:PX domain-containing protein n=1 Tax=Kipferlia bialata TaxID=797122 RepID=A0A9K3GKA4_9EUKA|nr:hypothetical protein KIPB_003002 [Kipferlia bialata]GIQ85406.1 hypothetical protein KIPB_007063 [Kipferlia bialata]|eukprot:g3002.t1
MEQSQSDPLSPIQVSAPEEEETGGAIFETEAPAEPDAGVAQHPLAIHTDLDETEAHPLDAPPTPTPMTVPAEADPLYPEPIALVGSTMSHISSSEYDTWVEGPIPLAVQSIKHTSERTGPVRVTFVWGAVTKGEDGEEEERVTICRDYSILLALRHHLIHTHSHCHVVPALPPREFFQDTGKHAAERYVEVVDRFLNQISTHEALRTSPALKGLCCLPEPVGLEMLRDRSFLRPGVLRRAGSGIVVTSLEVGTLARKGVSISISRVGRMAGGVGHRLKGMVTRRHPAQEVEAEGVEDVPTLGVGIEEETHHPTPPVPLAATIEHLGDGTQLEADGTPSLQDVPVTRVLSQGISADRTQTIFKSYLASVLGAVSNAQTEMQRSVKAAEAFSRAQVALARACSACVREVSSIDTPDGCTDTHSERALSFLRDMPLLDADTTLALSNTGANAGIDANVRGGKCRAVGLYLLQDLCDTTDILAQLLGLLKTRGTYLASKMVARQRMDSLTRKIGTSDPQEGVSAPLEQARQRVQETQQMLAGATQDFIYNYRFYAPLINEAVTASAEHLLGQQDQMY